MTIRVPLPHILALAAALLAMPASAAGLPAGDYKVGFITDNTGPLAAAGLSFTHGGELAAEEISASGAIGTGAKLVLSEKEAAGDPARAIQDMNQFIADRGILAVTCCIISPVAGSLKPVVLEAKLPMVIYGATMQGLPSPPYVYNVAGLPGPKDTATARHVAEALKSKSAVYFIAADNDAFKARLAPSQAALEAMGVKTLGTVSVLSADTDFTAAATQAMGLKPELMLIYTTQAPAAGIVAALRTRGYTGTIVGNDVLAPATMFKKLGTALVDVPFPLGFSVDLAATAQAKAFVAAYQKKFNSPPDLYSAEGYSAVWFIAQGLKSLDGAASRESLAAALARITSIEPNVFGGLPVDAGQAATKDTLIVSWSKDGTLVPWAPAK